MSRDTVWGLDNGLTPINFLLLGTKSTIFVSLLSCLMECFILEDRTRLFFLWFFYFGLVYVRVGGLLFGHLYYHRRTLLTLT